MKKQSTQNDTMQTNNLKAPQLVAHIPLWVSIVVIVGAVLSLAGAVISKFDPTLLTNGNPMTDAARVYTDYMFVRSLVLAGMLLFLLFLKARHMLGGFMVLIALIQIVDAIDDLARGAFLLAPGLIVFAIVFFLGAWRLFGQGIWHIDAWRDR